MNHLSPQVRIPHPEKGEGLACSEVTPRQTYLKRRELLSAMASGVGGLSIPQFLKRMSMGVISK